MKQRLLATAALAVGMAAPLLGAPVRAHAAPPPGNAWQLTFSDDFNGDGLDPSKWRVITDNLPNYVTARYPENVQVGDGVLALITRHESRGGKEWTSGSIKTATFQQAYGYFEAKLRYAPGHSLNNAFWLISDRPAMRGGNEIDINEGHFPGEVTNNLHAISHPNLSRKVRLNDDGAGQFHIYGALWAPPTGGRPAMITWYVDNRPVNSEPCPDCTTPARIYFSTAILNWMKPPGPELDGAAMTVKWVKAYQLAGPLAAPPPRIAPSDGPPGGPPQQAGGDPFWTHAPQGIPAKLDWLQNRVGQVAQDARVARGLRLRLSHEVAAERRAYADLMQESGGQIPEPDRQALVDRMHRLSQRLDGLQGR